MALFRRKRHDEDDVRWLAPTELRRRRPRGRWALGLLLLFLGAAAIFAAVVLLAPKPPPPAAPRGQVQESAPASPPEPAPSQTAPPSPAPVEPTPSPAEPAPASPDPAPPVLPAPEPPVAEETAPVAPDAAPAEEPAPEAPAESPLTGAFPPPSAESDDPDAPNFAVYLNEAAPDEASARTLVVEAQRRYSSVLGGGRLSYRRVRVGDETAFRLRLSGLTRARAAEICEALQGAGAGCEVGPR